MTKTDQGHGRATQSKDGGVRQQRWYRTSDAENDFIKALADEHDMTVSELIRDCLLVDMPITRKDYLEMESKGVV